jgi:hypothetical protein
LRFVWGFFLVRLVFTLFHVAGVACFAIGFVRLISFFSFRVELSSVKPLAEKSLLWPKKSQFVVLG